MDGRRSIGVNQCEIKVELRGRYGALRLNTKFAFMILMVDWTNEGDAFDHKGPYAERLTNKLVGVGLEIVYEVSHFESHIIAIKLKLYLNYRRKITIALTQSL